MGTFVRKEAVRCYNGLLQVYRAPRGSVKLWQRVAAKSLGANFKSLSENLNRER